MRYRFLLINPWIYDFAAYNLWSRPLGLIKVAEYLSSFDVSLTFVDCTDAYKPSKYGTGKFMKEIVEKPDILKPVPRFYKRYGITTDDFIERVKAEMPYDLILITSIMSYWYPGVQKVIEILRDLFRYNPIILGGIYATLYTEHASENAGADAIHIGELNRGFNMLLSTFGFRLKKRRAPVPYYRMGLYDPLQFAPLLTSTGCPYRCSYCASGLLNKNFVRRSIDDILKEIIDLYGLGVKDLAFYDDALLVGAEEHIKPLLRELIRRGINLNLHTPNGLHARLIDEELAMLMKKANFKTLRLSLETVNPVRQQESGGKVNNEELRRAVLNLKKAGFTKNEIGVYLMYGLPGQTEEEVIEGIEFLKGLGVRINLTEFSPIRGTRIWDELVRNGIIKDDIDPLLTNNSLFPILFSGLDHEVIQRMKTEVNMYNIIP
ncbi:MAG: B12-binding domain-containing radical SAM protein [Thermodesulfovibrionales bacterium]